MKKTFIYFIAITGLLMTSCELDQLPDGQLVAENAINDANSAENALNGAYLMFAGDRVDFTTDADITNWTSEHELVPSSLAGVTHNFTGAGFGSNANNLTSESFEIDVIWAPRYKVISATNGVIQAVENIPNDEFLGNRKSEIIAEAKFLRAYANFSLLSYFGEYYNESSEYGIILRNNLTTADDIVKARSSVSESYTAILNDLDDAIANCPDSNEKFYANKWAAKLLKARVLLYKGDYSEAKDLALDVINNGPYVLDNMQDLFQVNGINSSEVILGIQPKPNQNEHTFNFIQFNRYPPGGSFVVIDQTPSGLATLLQGDPRESWMIANPILPFYPWNGQRVTKYGGSVVEDAYAFRLTEAYLIASECYVRESNDAMSRTYLKDVLTKAGVTDFSVVDIATGDDLLYEIYAEYVKNMSIEDGHEWFALTRCLPFSQVQQLRPGIVGTEQFILPIPRNELIRNGDVAGHQNPGYDDL